MCGIVGFYSLGNECVSKEQLYFATQKIRHRGPNYQGISVFKEGRVGLGHARLSIIDLTSEANQPMRCGDYSVVFNGEIYNYIEIREELEQKGYEFFTKSDTEVLVLAYDCWGEECVCRFNGMWAFAIFDHKNDKLFCSRDRFGVKPFNYSLTNERFIFGSEIKSLLVLDKSLLVPNYNSIGLFAREGVGAEIDETWFQGVKRLKPGVNMIIKDKKVYFRSYYEYPKCINKSIKFEDAKKEYFDTFINALKIRMRSDVPIGSTLSGGLDSSSVVGGIRSFFSEEFQTFTAGFKDFKDNESEIAAKTAEKLNLSQNLISCEYSKESYLKTLKKIIYHLESGHFSPAIFPLWKIYEYASKKITVILEGQGADEHLCGYIESIAGIFIEDCVRRGNFLLAVRSLKQLRANYSLKMILILYFRQRLPSVFRKYLRKWFLGTENSLGDKIKFVKYPKSNDGYSNNFLIKSLQRSHQTTLVSLLHYGDAISMAFSMENRLPYMDYRLVDLAFSLSPEYFIRGGVGKYIQRESLKSIIPNAVYASSKKRGFPSPIEDFLSKNRIMLKEILLSSISKNRGIIDPKEFEKILSYSGEKWKKAHRFVFRMLCIELWFQEFIDNKDLKI